jgi:hypothetical protein
VNTRATVFVTFALTGGNPSASRTGYETTEARLATVLVTPARTPAPSSTKIPTQLTN